MDYETLPILGGIITFVLTLLACWHKTCRRKTFQCICNTDEDDCKLGVAFKNKMNKTDVDIDMSSPANSKEVTPMQSPFHTPIQSPLQSPLPPPISTPMNTPRPPATPRTPREFTPRTHAFTLQHAPINE